MAYRFFENFSEIFHWTLLYEYMYITNCDISSYAIQSLDFSTVFTRQNRKNFEYFENSLDISESFGYIVY